MIPMTRGKIFCAPMTQKVNFLEGLSPVISDVKHGISEKEHQQSNVVVVV